MKETAIVPSVSALPSMIQRAAERLKLATTSAEVLEARDLARVGFDAAKSAARFLKAKAAHDALIATVHRAQADALEIEAMAKRRLADEYDAAQERGEVRTRADNQLVPVGNKLSAGDMGLSRKDVHEARQIRDAEVIDPGIVNRTVTERLEAGHEPTRTAVRAAIMDVLARPQGQATAQPRRNPDYVEDDAFNDAAAVVDHAKELAAIFERRGASVLFGLPDDASRARAAPHLDRAREALISIGWHLRQPQEKAA